MDKQALETKLHFSQPIRQIIYDDVGHWIGEHRVVHGAE